MWKHTLLVAVASLSSLLADETMVTIDLKDGSRLTAPQLHANDQRILVDLAGQAIALDRERIEHVEVLNSEETVQETSDRLYSTGNLNRSSVDQLVET